MCTRDKEKDKYERRRGKTKRKDEEGQFNLESGHRWTH